MSVLETPRILFRGQCAWDPITTNNYPRFYDEDSCDPVPDLPPLDVAQFREDAIAAVATEGSWNPHGTHRSSFFETEVSGADLGEGVLTDDPFVGAPASFLGMLVDCEPYGSVSSQLFFDKMQFGIPGGCRITLPRRSRFIARYINFNRNSFNWKIAGVASVVWQTSFAKADGLAIDPQNSPSLQALAQAMDQDDVLGLTVRWNAYRTIYFDDPSLRNGSASSNAANQALIDKLNTGGWQPNPARSLVVGVIGLWRKGEPASEPGDRALLSIPPGEVVATAHARLAGDRLTIDLQNSISEVDDLLSKQNLGTLSVVAVSETSDIAPITLGTLSYPQYDRPSYERDGGIVTLRLTSEGRAAARTGRIEIRSGEGEVYLAEQRFRPLPVEHNRYVNGNDPATPAAVQLYDRGRPAGQGIDVTMYDGTTMVPIATAATNADGQVEFEIAPVPCGGSYPYIFQAAGQPAPQQLDTQVTPYMYVRSLPADEAIGRLPPTWANVYNYVLINWNAMAPCMDNWLRLDDPDQVRAYAPVLRRLTDPGFFENYTYMPVTRDMTAGERTLLYAFLDSPQPDQAGGTAMLQGEAPAKPRLRNLAKLSRAMRSG